MWALGAAIGPLIIGNFLVDLPPKDIAKDIVNWTSESSVLDAAGIIQTALQWIATVVDLHIYLSYTNTSCVLIVLIFIWILQIRTT